MACLLLALAALPSCREKEPEPTVAEFLDETPDGLAQQGESLRIVLDHPYAAGAPPETVLENVTVRADPPVPERWTTTVRATRDPRVLRVEITTGTPSFHAAGLHGRDAGATGIGLDFGTGVSRWVDLQLAPSLPVLQRVIWEDRSAPGGNLVVDAGDWLRLLFDRPVKLEAPSEESRRARAPGDILLSKSTDRLDDSVLPSRFEEGTDEREVRIVLGSNPVLTVAGTLAGSPAEVERFQQGAPSGLALDGTRIIPMRKIVDRRGGPGAVSEREVDVELPAEVPLPRARAAEPFPAPGNRAFHTVTPLLGWRALICGGEAVEGRQTLDQVLLYDPFHEEARVEAFRLVGRLPHPAQRHTATTLAGPGGRAGAGDDVVVIAGGSDGTDLPLDDLTVVMAGANGELEVIPLAAKLFYRRSEHAAAAFGPRSVVVDGGIGPDGILECAERITLAFDGGRPRVEEHVAFRTLARMRHTLTALPPGPGGEEYLLAYGGYGRDRRRFPRLEPFGAGLDGASGEDVRFPVQNGVVLISPVLLDPAHPERSHTILAYEFHLSLLRSEHAAVSLDAGSGDNGGGEPGAGAVVAIAGGTSRHLLEGFGGSINRWEIPVLPSAPPRPPQGHEAADIVLFHFRAASPRESRLEVVRHPAPDPGQAPERIHFAAVPVPGYGLLLTGGEPSGDRRESLLLRSVEVLFPGERRLAVVALPLSSARARHGGYAVERDGARSVFLLGGITGDGSAVEEIPLR